MENIVGVLFIFGAAIVVGGIIIVDMVRKKNTGWQVGCLRIGSIRECVW
ncbi:MAG: hypothetical protein ACWA5R_01790 [bacterium]